MNISRLTLPILSLHYLADKGLVYTTDEVYENIEKGVIFEDIINKFGNEYDDIRLDGLKLNKHLSVQEDKEVIEALRRLAPAVLPEEFGVDNKQNGLLFLAGLLNELIQQSDIEIDFK